MSDDCLAALRDAVQVDIAGRGLARDPADNLLTRTTGDFAAACRSIAETVNGRVGIVTGFTIPGTSPPTSETDGPPGALFLARALVPLGIDVVIAADGTAVPALAAGLAACQLTADVPLVELSPVGEADAAALGPVSHLISIERLGPTHSSGRCLTMRGLDATAHTRPAHRLFESSDRAWVTIGIGDGGNEIGMGKLPREVIARNIPLGDTIACRTATDHLIVAGVSNWGAYALALGVSGLRTWMLDSSLFDAARELSLLQQMVDAGPLVDGLTRERAATVDGMPFERHAEVLARLKRICA